MNRSRASAVAPIVGAILVCAIAAGLSPFPARAAPAATKHTLSTATIQVRPVSGPAGRLVAVRGNGFYPGCTITISFTDASGTNSLLKGLDGRTSFKTRVSIPSGAALGAGTIYAHQLRPGISRCVPFGLVNPPARFTVTGDWRRLR